MSDVAEGLAILDRVWRRIITAGEAVAYRLPPWADIPVMAVAYTVALATVVAIPLLAVALWLPLLILLPILAILS